MKAVENGKIYSGEVLWWDERHKEGQILCKCINRKFYFNWSVYTSLIDIERGQILNFILGDDNLIDEVF